MALTALDDLDIVAGGADAFDAADQDQTLVGALLTSRVAGLPSLAGGCAAPLQLGLTGGDAGASTIADCDIDGLGHRARRLRKTCQTRYTMPTTAT